MREVLQLVELEWKATVIAVTSDCGGESRAARAAIVRERPELVGPDCYAHQACYIDINSACTILTTEYRLSSLWVTTSRLTLASSHTPRRPTHSSNGSVGESISLHSCLTSKFVQTRLPRQLSEELSPGGCPTTLLIFVFSS